MRRDASLKHHPPDSLLGPRVGLLLLLAFLLVPMSDPRVVGDARAQQSPSAKVYRIGFLSQGQPPKALIEALQQGLRERGYAEGQNLVWVFRSTDGSLDQLPRFAEELVSSKVDLILARASSGAMAAKRATTSIPIVFFAVYDPVEIGIVPSLSRPGGNVTGVAVTASDMAAKRVQLVKDLVPALKALRGIDGVLHADTPLFVTHRARLVNAVAESRLPAIYPARLYVEAGGLVSYGPNLAAVWKAAAPYVDKILKGSKAWRSSCRAANDVRVDDQQQDGQSHGPDNSAIVRDASGSDL